MKKTILQTRGLTKKYGEFTALDSVSLALNEGDIYGLVGRNGAGKTTFFKRYYDDRYALEDHYYTVVPLDYDITPQWASNADGQPVEPVIYYHLICYNADGEARQLTGRVRVEMADPYPPGTYLCFSASKQHVIGQRILDESDVPAKALEKIKETHAPNFG